VGRGAGVSDAARRKVWTVVVGVGDGKEAVAVAGIDAGAREGVLVVDKANAAELYDAEVGVTGTGGIGRLGGKHVGGE